MTETIDPIQAQLIRARRNQILDAATAVFAEKGFHRATIRDIARTAGIADGTIYNYFGSKNDLLIGILDRLNETEERDEHFARGLEGDVRQFFVSYLRQRMTLLWPNYEVFQALLPEILVNAELRELYYEQVMLPTLSIAEQFFQRMVVEGEIRPIDVPLTTRAIASMMMGLLIMRILGDESLQQEWDRVPEVLASLLFDGLGLEGGRGVEE
ncbi:MAG: TetR/AcrR family transcriptional regulator [Chloroflexota bacterium]|nr:TetR/AcrR family transcriptional regulator [Chloroflexota bacterium]